MSSRPMQKYAGSCHCGAVRFEFCSHDFDPAGIPLRQTVGAGMP